MLAKFLFKPVQIRAVYTQRMFFSEWERNDKISWTQRINDENANNEMTNPYYNPRAVGLKKELDMMQDSIKSWQEDFKKKNGRKPTLEEMRKDPSVGPIIASIDKQKKDIKASLQKFKFS